MSWKLRKNLKGKRENNNQLNKILKMTLLSDMFIEISRFLHFTNNIDYMYQQSDPNYDRLWKIRPVITAISEKFLNTENPQNTVSIDEVVIPFKGRCSLKQ